MARCLDDKLCALRLVLKQPRQPDNLLLSKVLIMVIRRSDREITATEDFTGILKDGTSAQIAFIDGNEPYLVTLSYGFAWQSGRLKLYFHSAHEGRKIECVKKNPKVCFAITICDSFVKGKEACRFSLKYRSIVGYGTMLIVKHAEEKVFGLNLLMNQHTGKIDWPFDRNMMSKTTVCRLDVEKMTGKRNI